MTERRRDLAELLRSCVQCGLCLPHCATYLASGNEVLSPRGRLVLLDDLLGEQKTPPDAYLSAFDQCIGCRACESVCPSGVPFDLMAHGQHLAAGRRQLTGSRAPEPALPEPLLKRLDSVAVLRAMGALAGATRSLCRAIFGRYWRRSLAQKAAPLPELSRLLGSLPHSPARDPDLVRLLDGLVARAGRATGAPAFPGTAPAAPPRPLMFFRGCANAGLLAGTSRRLVRSLIQAGFAVEIVAGQECCGALASHSGRPGRAAELRRHNLSAFGTADDDEATPIVVEAAGCTLELKDYNPEFGARVVDAVSLLASAPPPALAAVPLTVVLHDPCHARHGLGVITEPRALLDSIPGLTWCEPVEKEVCCGSGGAWGLRYPDMSATLARRKAADLAATGADLVVTTNPGCLGQIADGLAQVAPDLPILPLTDLWWYAARQAEERPLPVGNGQSRTV